MTTSDTPKNAIRLKVTSLILCHIISGRGSGRSLNGRHALLFCVTCISASVEHDEQRVGGPASLWGDGATTAVVHWPGQTAVSN